MTINPNIVVLENARKMITRKNKNLVEDYKYTRTWAYINTTMVNAISILIEKPKKARKLIRSIFTTYYKPINFLILTIN